MRPVALALLALLTLVSCGGQENTTCPAGYVCTPMPEGGTMPPGGAGATVIASEIQVVATNLVSDGTTLYWTSSSGPPSGISAIPVAGGAVSTAVAGPVSGGFLAVDDTYLYYPGQSGGYYRSPKHGGAATLITGAGAQVGGFTLLGSSAYWLEVTGSGPTDESLVVKTAPAQGGAASVLATILPQAPGGGGQIAVTSRTVFLRTGLGPSSGLVSFPIVGGLPSGSTPTKVSGTMGCEWLVSDSDAVYCYDGSIIAVADDGSTITLGTVVDDGQQNAGTGSVATDEMYVYWTDQTTVGTIMRGAKSGGTPTILARDTSPEAIAVDSNAIYWSDKGGNIMRLPK